MRVAILQIDQWLSVSACLAGLLVDNRTPIGSGRLRERSQDPRSLGISFSYSF